MSIETYMSRIFIVKGDSRINACYVTDGTATPVTSGRCRYLARVAVTNSECVEWVQGVEFNVVTPTHSIHGRPNGLTVGTRDSFESLRERFTRPPRNPANQVSRNLKKLLEYFPHNRANVHVTILSEFCPRFDIGEGRPNLSTTYMPVLEQVCREVSDYIDKSNN